MSVLRLALMIVMMRMLLQWARIHLPSSQAGRARVQTNFWLIAGLFHPVSSTLSLVGGVSASK